MKGLIDIASYLNNDTYLNYDLTSTEIALEAKKHGVDFINNVGLNLIDSKSVIIQAQLSSNVFATVGISPINVNDNTLKEMNELDDIAMSPKVIAIGETGINISKNYVKKLELQTIVFDYQVGLANRLNLPVLIKIIDDGTFKAYRIVYEVLKKHKTKNFIIHAYDGNLEWAEKFIELKGYISFDGRICNDKDKQEIAKNISLNHIFLESNSPNYIPYPYQKDINYPKYMAIIVMSLANIKKTSANNIIDNLRHNKNKLFNI